MIVPAFPELNIYSYSKTAGSVVSVGAVMVATIASKMLGWKVEIIDENNYSGPRDRGGFPDHAILQAKDPADVVGFYCGLTSTIERVWKLAEFYKASGAKTIAGGWHASYCPGETLNHNIDIVVHGDGEPVIQRILVNMMTMDSPYSRVTGCSYICNGEVTHNGQIDVYMPQIPDMDERLDTLRNEVEDLDNLPFPDFSLIRFAKIRVYPITRIRGCGMKCEFCSVNRWPIWASPKHLFETVKWLVETRRAKKFFIVDDRMEEDLPGTIEFFKMITEEFGSRCIFFVQTRLGVAKNKELLEILRAAGVRTLFIGCESPIDEDLKDMQKGYTSKNMLEWVKILRRYFWVHGMFIFGYPPKQKNGGLSAKEMFHRFKWFIFKAGFDSIQILKPIPLVGTWLRRRLEMGGRILPFDLAPWNKYDGNSVCFIPDNMSLSELHNYPMKLMKNFYSPTRLLWVILRTIFFPFDYLFRGWTIGFQMGWLDKWSNWHKGWFAKWHKGWQKDLIKCVGHIILAKWQKRYKKSGALEKIEKYCRERDIS